MDKPVLLATAVAAGALAFGGWQYFSLSATKVRLKSAHHDRDRAQADLRDLQQRLDGANRRVVEAELKATSLKDDFDRIFSKKDTTAVVTSGAQPPTKPGFIANVGATRRGGSLLFRSTPPQRALETSYQALYRQLKLTPEQTSRFKAAMTEATTRFQDLERDARQKRTSPMDKSMQPLFAEADAELRAKLTAVAGAEAMPAIERFTETVFLRDAVAQLVSELFYTDTPLTEPQANQLVEILARNMRDPAGRLNHVFADGSAMKADAESVLSPPQLAAWRELIDALARTAFASLNPARR